MSNAAIAKAGFLGAVTGAMLTVFMIIGIIWFVLQVIAWWKIFTKAGEKGWKSIIPIYNYYVQIKLTWDKKFFWIILLLVILTGICHAGVQNGCTFIGTPIIEFIALIAILVFVFIGIYRLCKSFGHGGGWTVGFIFLETIFILMLGFGKSEYKGNVYLQEKGK